MLSDKKHVNILSALSLIIPLAIFSITAWNSYGWDDEFFNIGRLEFNKSFLALIHHVNTTDLHPMGQYVINFLLYKVFGSYQSVRTAGAILTALSLWIYWHKTQRSSTTSNLLAYILLCLNPSILLWCSGLRWYTWLIPPVCALGLLMQKSGKNLSERETNKFWVCYFLLSIIMFHIAYCAIVIILVSFVCLIYERRKFLKREIKTILYCSIVSVLAISYQAFYFLTVHLKNGSHKLASMLGCIIGAGQNFLCGSAVIPISLSGIFFITGGLFLFVIFLFNAKHIIKSCQCKFFVFSCLVNIILKCAPGARYYTGFNVQQADFQVDTYSQIKNNKLRILILCLYFLGSVSGIYKIMTHTDTIKASWDTPYEKIINYVINSDPEKKSLVLTSNPVLAWHIRKNGFTTIDITGSDINDPESRGEYNDWKGSVIAVKTFRGSMNPEKYRKYVEYIESSNIKSREKFGYEKYAWFKRKLIAKSYPDYPDYMVEIFTFER